MTDPFARFAIPLDEQGTPAPAPADPFAAHTVTLPDGFGWEDGKIIEPIGDGSTARIYNDMEHLRTELMRRGDRALAEQLNRQASAQRLRDQTGPLANVVAGMGGSIESTRRALGIGDAFESDANRVVQEASQELSPGLWGDIQRGVGGAVADLPLMFTGGPLAQGAARIKAVANGGTVVRAMLPVAASSQALALREGLETARDKGVVNGLGAWAIETVVPAAFGMSGAERAIIGQLPWEKARQVMVPKLRQVLVDAGMEGAEEVATELAHAVHEQASGMDTTALTDIAKLGRRLAAAGAVGGLMGAGFGAAKVGGEAIDEAYQRHYQSVKPAVETAQGAALEQALAPHVVNVDAMPADAGSVVSGFNRERLEELGGQTGTTLPPPGYELPAAPAADAVAPAVPVLSDEAVAAFRARQGDGQTMPPAVIEQIAAALMAQPQEVGDAEGQARPADADGPVPVPGSANPAVAPEAAGQPAPDLPAGGVNDGTQPANGAVPVAAAGAVAPVAAGIPAPGTQEQAPAADGGPAQAEPAAPAVPAATDQISQAVDAMKAGGVYVNGMTGTKDGYALNLNSNKMQSNGKNYMQKIIVGSKQEADAIARAWINGDADGISVLLDKSMFETEPTAPAVPADAAAATTATDTTTQEDAQGLMEQARAGEESQAPDFAPGDRVRWKRGKKMGVEATVETVRPDGRLVLRRDDGRMVGKADGIDAGNVDVIRKAEPAAKPTMAERQEKLAGELRTGDAIPRPAAPAHASPDEVAAEARRRFAAKRQARAGSGLTPEQRAAVGLKPTTPAEVAAVDKAKALQEARAKLMQLGAELKKTGRITDLSSTDEIAGATDDAAFGAIEALYRAGITDFAGMMAQIRAFDLPFAAQVAFHEALEDAFDAFQESAQGMQPRGDDFAARHFDSTPKAQGYTGQGASDERPATAESGRGQPGDTGGEGVDTAGSPARNGEGDGSRDSRPAGRRGDGRGTRDAGSDSHPGSGEPTAGGAPANGGSADPVRQLAGRAEGQPGGGAAPAGDGVGQPDGGGDGRDGAVGGQRVRGRKPRGGRDRAGDTAGAGGKPGQKQPRGDGRGAGETVAAPEQAPSATITPDTPAAGRPDFFMADPAMLLGGGPKAKFKRNRDAIETFAQVTAENRAPTPAELDAIASYIGWGSFGQELFQGTWDRPMHQEGWDAEGQWLREHLGEADWKAAQASIVNAHFTDPPTVEAHWRMLRQLGFTGGRVLEPSMGVGNYFALMPRDIHAGSMLTGIELDPTTGKMARMLHPNANVRIMGFQESQTADNFYDLAIGNVPFGDFTVADKRYDRFHASIHNYFFMKALDQVRPGGFVSFITSSYTMDGVKNERVRQYLAAKADLVASFRLPSGAFQQYAGTKVVTDLIILQKRLTDAEPAAGHDAWTGLAEVDTPSGKPVRISRYYADHPDHILGTLDVGRGTTFNKEGMIVTRREDFPQVLAKIHERLPSGIYVLRQETGAKVHYVTNNTTARQREVVVQGDRLFRVEGDRLAEVTERWQVNNPRQTARRLDQVQRLMAIREAYGQVLDTQRSGDEAATSKALETLNKAYDTFVAKHGPINESEGLSILERKLKDPSADRLAALERQEGGEWVKRPVFVEPQMRSRKTADNLAVGDAYAVARNEAMTLDLDRVAALARKSREDVIRELVGSGTIFKTPTGIYEPADVYLAGNVRLKLREAIDAAQQGMGGLDASIEALRQAVPKDIPYPSIEVKLGATWITSADYADFLGHLLNEPAKYFTVRRMPDAWKVEFERDFINHKPEAAKTWGHERVPFSRLFTAAINNQSVTIKDRWRDESGDHEEVNPEATAQANAQVEKVREEFRNWVWNDPERATRLEAAYNETFNSIAIPKYDGSHLAFEGMALLRGDSPFALRQHQANAIWRGLVTGRMLGAHEVGTGKTYTMAGLCMESRRLGLARKPLVLAHNANAADVAKDFQAMYPGARILYVDNLEPKIRNKTLEQIATDEWDAVILPHSLLNRLCLRPETVQALLKEQIEALEQEAYEAVDEDNGNSGALDELFRQAEGDLDTSDKNIRIRLAKLKSPTAKELVKQRFRLTAQIEKARNLAKEGAVSLEDMGVDMLVVDEAHVFKKLPIATKMKLKGLNTAASQNGTMLMMAADFIRGANNGRGVHLFTGTPITNTVNEIYNMQRLVMAEDMRRDGIYSWDGWFNSFAAAQDEVELTSGGTWDTVTRLSAFINVPELRRNVGQVMDTVFASDMPEFKPRASKEGRSEDPQGRPYKEIRVETAPMSPDQQEQMAVLRSRYEAWTEADKKTRKQWMKDGSEYVPVLIETEGVKSAMDPRLVRLGADGDDANLKVNRCAAKIMEHYREDPKSTQMVFAQVGFTDEAERSVRGAPPDPVTGKRPTEKVATFPLVQHLVDKLVAEGIPRDEIAVFSWMTGREAKAEAAAAMREGRIRVAIGSSQTMGTGVNAQTYLRAMHHLDAPWVPADQEQRNGRGHRQGNTWNTVLEYRYLTEGSHDGRRWQVLLTKSRFINKFMRDDLGEARVIEGDATNLDEEGGDAEGFASTFSSAVGDPRIQVRTKLEKDVAKLEAAERRHAQAATKAADDLRKLGTDRDLDAQALEKAQRDADQVAKGFQEPFSITIDGTTYTERKEADAAIQELGKKPPEKARTLGRYRGFTVAVDSHGLNLVGESSYPAGWSTASLDGVLRAVPGKVERLQEKMAKAEQSRASLEDMRRRPFARGEELTQKRKRLEGVIADLSKNPMPPPPWLRDGAPVGSTVMVDGKDFEVAGHRVAAEGYFVLVNDGAEVRAVPILEVRDDQGGELFAGRPAKPDPADLPHVQAAAAVSAASQAKPAAPTRTPNGIEVGQRVRWDGGEGEVVRIEAGTLDDERTWQVEVRQEDGTQDMVPADQVQAVDEAPGDLAMGEVREPGPDNADRDAAFFKDDGNDEGAGDELAADHEAKRQFVSRGVPKRVKVAPQAGDAPAKLADIVLGFGEALTEAGVGRTQFTHAGMRSEQKGVYKPASGQTAIRHNNLDAAAHEIGHRLDDFFRLTAPQDPGDKQGMKRWKAAMKDLHWFSYFGSIPPATLNRAQKMAYFRAEGLAEWLRALIVNPAAADALAPEMMDRYRKLVPQAVQDAVRGYSDQVRAFAARSESEKTTANVRGVEEASDEAGKAKVGSKLRAALGEVVEVARRMSGDVGERGQQQRKASIPSLRDSKLNMGWKDSVTFGWFDSWWPAIRGYRTALELRSGEVPPIEKDFETLVRLHAGFADRMDSMFIDGLVDFHNKPLMYRGQRMNLEWLLAPAVQAGKSKEEIAAILDRAMAQGVEERTVEEGRRNLNKAQMEAKAFRMQLELADPGNPDNGKRAFAFMREKVREAREKNSRLTGIAGGLDSDYDQARRALKEREGDQATKQINNEILRRYRAWTDAILDYCVQAEVLGPDQAEAIRKTHQHYIDLHRVVEVEKAAIPVHGFLGSTRTIDNPLMNLMHATWSALQWADQNRVRRAFTDMLTIPRSLHQGEPVDLSTIGREVTEDEMKPMKDGGKKDDDGRIDGRRPYSVRVLETEPGKDGRDRIVSKTKWWVFDPAVEAGFEAAHAFDNPSAIAEILTGVKRLTQKTITAAPPFLIRQVQRDTVSRLVTTEVGSGFADLFKGYTEDLHGRGVGERYKMSGGGQAGWDEKGKQAYQRRLAAVLHEAVHDGNRIVTWMGKLASGYKKLAHESDLANRRAEYRRAWDQRYRQEIQEGATETMASFRADLWAARQARGLMDFAVAGHHARAINRYIVFFNAACQALRRANRAISKGHRTSTLVRMGILGVASALLWAMHDDDDKEELRQRPAAKRDFHWSFKVAPNLWIDVPKPYEWGVLASGFERALDAASGKENAWEGYPTSFKEALLPWKEEYLAGSLRPFIEARLNKSFFTDRPIVPTYEEKLDLEKRKGTANASPLGQALMDAIGIDARKVDHVIAGTMGGFGRIATARTGDAGWWAGATSGMFGRSPAWEARDVQWVLETAEGQGKGNRPDVKALKRLLHEATAAETPEERDAKAAAARAKATKIREGWR